VKYLFKVNVWKLLGDENTVQGKSISGMEGRKEAR
jgi:hypothetical protein